mgnify:CR=1 FL=1
MFRIGRKALLLILLSMLILASGVLGDLSRRDKRRLKRSVVAIQIVEETDYDATVVSYGTGFFAENSEGEVRIYTAYHVVDLPEPSGYGDIKIIICSWDDDRNQVSQEYYAEHAACDPEVDLASLKIEREIDPTSPRGYRMISQGEIDDRFSDYCLELELDYEDQPDVLDKLVVVGYPWRELQEVVLQFCRAEVGGYNGEGYLLLNPHQPFDHGLSGGPVLDEDGDRVHGVAVAITGKNGAGADLAMPSNEMRQLYHNEEELTGNCRREESRGEIASVRGNVVDEESGEPINNVNIQIIEPADIPTGDPADIDSRDVLASGKTDYTGRFVCDPELSYPRILAAVVNDPDGRYEVAGGTFEHDPRPLNIEMTPSDGGYGGGGYSDELIPQENRSGRTCVRGRITDEDTGDPIEGIMVAVFEPEDVDEMHELQNLQEDDFKAIGASDYLGEYRCDPRLPYPDELTAIVLDEEERFEPYAATFQHDTRPLNIQLERNIDGYDGSGGYSSGGYGSAGGQGVTYTGEIEWDYGPDIEIGVLVAFESYYQFERYAELASYSSSRAQEYAEENAIGAGLAADGGYFILFEEEPPNTVCLTVTSTEGIGVIRRCRLWDGKRLVVPQL